MKTDTLEETIATSEDGTETEAKGATGLREEIEVREVTEAIEE